MAAASPRLFAHVVVLLLAAAAGSPAASAARLGMRYRVGGQDGWRVPPPEDKEMYYVNWASPIAFYVKDSVEFVYRNDSVIKVSKAGYYHCNETAGIGADTVPRDGSTLFLLDAPGYAYFASADLDHCNKGERLMVNVLAAEPPSPSWPSPAAAPATSLLSPLSSPAPAPSMEYATAAGASLVASFAHALLAPVTLALAGLV